MSIFFIASLVFSGLFLMSLTMSKHYNTFFKNGFSKRIAKQLKYIGWLLLLVAIVVSTTVFSTGVGLAVFFNTLAATVFVVIFLYSYYDKLLPPLAIFMPIIAGILFLVS